MKKGSKFPLYAGLGFLAAAVRLAAAWWLLDSPASTDWEIAYHPLAQDLLHGRAPLDWPAHSNGSPLYVVFLAALYKLGGPGAGIMRAAQAVMDGATTLAVFALGLAVFNRRTALLAALAYALHPLCIYMAGLGQPELPLALVATIMVLAMIRARRLGEWWADCAAGSLLSLSLLFKPNFLGFLPFWLGAELVLGWGRWRALFGRAALILAGFTAVWIPWRLLAASPQDQGRASLYARIIYTGSVLRPSLSDGSLFPREPFYEDLAGQEGLYDKNMPPAAILRKAAGNWAALAWPNPLRLPWFLARKFAQVWYATDRGGIDRWLRWFQLPLAFLCLAGCVLSWRETQLRRAQWPVFLPMTYTVSALMVVTPLLRELMPVFPMIFLYAAYAVDRAWSKLSANPSAHV